MGRRKEEGDRERGKGKMDRLKEGEIGLYGKEEGLRRREMKMTKRMGRGLEKWKEGGGENGKRGIVGQEGSGKRKGKEK